MPVCGTHLVAHLDSETNPAPDVDMGLLCLRWTQLAAFMPGMRSWYKDNDFTRMPYQLAKQYQEYITWALDRRYQLLPYMRTLQLAWTTSGTYVYRSCIFSNQILPLKSLKDDSFRNQGTLQYMVAVNVETCDTFMAAIV